MGAVHAAFDPDLERRVALKVLRVAGEGDAERRLLREARAMARLVHPNVVTVHEVGSENGRDYIAMELIEGETLAEWLRASRRPERAIIEAFMAAGRGLAAAHAAGIVHRDFKPHNVLRRADGRIVVTDFGLAREAEESAGAPGAAGESDAPRGDDAGSRSSALVGITITGSLLGTPAYMAPEQWRGGAVSQATDQFAFCVALWEALAGERPFRGESVEALRAEILAGPAALSPARVPRRLRAALLRGLDPQPARRWPSMDALLAAMARAERRPLLLAGAIAAAIAAVVAIGAHALGGEAVRSQLAATGCPAAALEPDAVWSDAARHRLAMKRPHEARALDADFSAWTAARARTCARGALAQQAARHVCLDAVLVRLDAIARAVEALPASVATTDPGELLIDPLVCERERLPRLAAAASAQLREVATAYLAEAVAEVPMSATAAAALVARAASDPCAAAAARLLLAHVTPDGGDRVAKLREAEQDAERCNDDRVRADVATVVARHALSSGNLTSAITASVKSAEVAVERVVQRDLAAELDHLRLIVAVRTDRFDEAIARGEAAVAGYAARGRIAPQLKVGAALLELRDLRARPEDLELVPQLYDEWRTAGAARLGEAHPIVHLLDGAIAMRRFALGEVAVAHQLLEALRRPAPHEHARVVRGHVVGADGRPAVGATVTAGAVLLGDSLAAAVPVPGVARSMRSAVTDRAGAFELPDAPRDGVIIAELGDLRSRPAAIGDRVHLQLGPTSRIEGRVALAGELAQRVTLGLTDLAVSPSIAYSLMAPVQADGSFVVSGAPRGRVRVTATLRNLRTASLHSAIVEVRERVVRGVRVALASSARVVHVIVRSTVEAPVTNAQVYVLPGQQASTNVLRLSQVLRTANYAFGRQIEGERAPSAVLRRARPGDLFATIADVPEGTTTACAVGLPHDLGDRDLLRKMTANLAKIEIRCAPVPPGADVVEIEVPPWPRL
jgi:hypothetical protein